MQVICLMGPTACGKTAAAIELAEKGDFEIISVDSAMIYRGMDIGTAKPSAEALARAPHHLINIRDPVEAYSVGDFIDDTLKLIDQIHTREKIPLLVGGTMMYFHQLQRGYSELPSSDEVTRKQVAQMAQDQGWPALYELLQQIDPIIAAQLHPNDSQRISRALEIFYQTKVCMSEWHRRQTIEMPAYDFKNIILAPQDRGVIHQRIESRFDQMLDQGFMHEVEVLYKRGDLNSSLPSIRCVGYRQAWDYLDGNCRFEDMRERAIVATRQLCKRQFTWLRRWSHAVWIHEPQAIKVIL